MRTYIMKKLVALLAATAGLLAIGGALGACVGTHASSDSGTDRVAGVPAGKLGAAMGQVAATVPPETLKHLQQGRHTAPLATPGPSICNAPISSGGTVADVLAQQYGEVRSCIAVGSSWVITTLGFPGVRHGVIAVYMCSTNACESGLGPYVADRFRTIAPPYPGGVTVLGSAPGQQGALLVDDGGHQLVFDVTNLSFAATATNPH